MNRIINISRQLEAACQKKKIEMWDEFFEETVEEIVSMGYDEKENGIEEYLELLEVDYPEKIYYGNLKTKEQIEEYFNKICYGMEVQESFTAGKRQYYVIREYSPMGNQDVSLIYEEDGILYNHDEDDILKINLEFK